MSTLYNRILLATLILCAGAVYLVSWRQQPLEGDLTRTGGFSERQFGWQGSQEEFETPFLFRVGYSLDDLDGPYDVVILGDSFTRRSGNSWASYVADRTGWKMLGFHHRDVTLDKLLASKQFRANPPSLVVFQTVERHALRRLSQLKGTNPPGPLLAADREQLAMHPLNAPKVTHERPEAFTSLNERLSVGVHILKTRLKTLVTGEPHARVMALRPEAPELFSSRARDRILLLNDDFVLRRRWAGREPEAAAGYLDAQQALGRSGIPLVLMVFPDKLTVYADYLLDPTWQGTSAIPTLAESISMPRLDVAYVEAVAKGTVDLYAPNNTHTSSTGSRLAADVFLEYLSRTGTVQPDSTIAETRDKHELHPQRHAG